MTSMKKKENSMTLKVTQSLLDPFCEKFEIVHNMIKGDWLEKLESVGMASSHVRRTTANAGLVQEA